MNKITQIWLNLRSSLWFLPSIIVGGSTALAVFLIGSDSVGIDRWLARWPRFFGAGAEGARVMLSTIAGSMMSVVGVTFSMTLVALAMASSQYTSRILRNFMRSRPTQAVLGVFAGIFAYCLIVLCSIRSGEEGAFVPGLAVFVGFVLAIGGVGVLIFFIHHVASSIQASSIVASVAGETLLVIDQQFPKQLGHGPEPNADDPTPFPMAGRKWRVVPARSSGYIQTVDDEALLQIAREQKAIVRMERAVGEFVVQNTGLVSLASNDQPDPKETEALQEAFMLARHRSVEQDAAFGIRQLVDVALKALSPGINDTTTALTCLNYLTTILARLAPQQIFPSHQYEEGELRVIARGPTFQSLLSEAFDQIRESAQGNVTVMLEMLAALQTVASLTASPSRRQLVCEQLEHVTELARRTIKSPHDSARFESRFTEVQEAIASRPKKKTNPRQ